MSETTYKPVFEPAPDRGWSGHVPELATGAIVVGADTREEAERLMAEAIKVHIEELKGTE